MKRPIKITISGYLGSGKTVVGKAIAEKYDLKYYSTGSIQREIAAKRGIDTLELNRLSEISRDIDDTIDDFSRGLNHKDEDFLIDSRLAWNFIDEAFKVFLKVDEEEATRRIMEDRNRKSEKYHNLDEAMNAIRSRRASETARFLKLYGVELYDEGNYHLVVNTTHRRPEETVELISQYFEKFQNGERFHILLD